MPIATTNQVALRIIEEATFGLTPTSPALKGLRFTNEGLIANKETAVSEVIRSDRQRDFLAEVQASGEGDIGLEPAFGDELDLMLRGVLQSEFDVVYIGTLRVHAAENIDSTAPTASDTHGGTLTLTSSILLNSIVVGEPVDLAGSGTQDGRYRIESISSDGLTVTVDATDGDAPLATEVGSGDESLTNTTLGVDVVAGTRTISRDDGVNWADDGFEVGAWIRLAGMTTSSGANNGIYKIESLSTVDLVAQTGYGNVGNLVDETGAGHEQVYMKKIKNGQTPRSYTLEKEYIDVTQYQVFKGMRFASLALSVETGAIVTGTLTMSGKGDVDMDPDRSNLSTSGASEVDPDTSLQLNATSNVGNLFEGGAALTTAIGAIAITIENNLRNVDVVGSKFPSDVNSGFVDVTGSLTAFFEDKVLFDKFIEHTQSALAFSFTDGDGNVIVFELPRIYYGTGSPTTPGGNEEVDMAMEFTAIREQVTGGVSIEIDVLPATLP